MQEGRSVFAQLMDFVPKYEFAKCVERYDGDTHKALVFLTNNMTEPAMSSHSFTVVAGKSSCSSNGSSSICGSSPSMALLPTP